jgi:acetyl esterase/lipase
MRAGIEQMHRALPCFADLDRNGVIQNFVQIPVRDGSSIPAAVFRPEGLAAGPLAVLYHAGAFVIG